MKKYNVGIIGYGWVATAHINAINACSDAQVTAVYSSRQINAAELNKKWGSPITTYTDLDTMLADKISILFLFAAILINTKITLWLQPKLVNI